MKKTIGGDRLGSGNNMRAELHNYRRSTHDLGYVWRSTMAPGVLIPFCKKLALNGDTWSINLKTLIKTVPAIGPLFGSYKLQLDVFECPIRLYNGILHNNMTKIGMDMAKVKLPKIELTGYYEGEESGGNSNFKFSQVAPSSLMAYLGVRGIGISNNRNVEVDRQFNAVPVLAYYDIFKNYYSNKQEEMAYVVDNDLKVITSDITKGIAIWANNEIKYYTCQYMGNEEINQTNIPSWQIVGNNEELRTNNVTQLEFNYIGGFYKNNSHLIVQNIDNQDIQYLPQFDYANNRQIWTLEIGSKIICKINPQAVKAYMELNTAITNWWNYTYMGIAIDTRITYNRTIKLEPFKLDNIDTMRINILKATALNNTFLINDQDLQPYKSNWEVKEDLQSGCANPMQGLVVKTYQSDIFNNWLSKNWIDGVNGINEISAVAIEDGKFTIDALNLAHKVYNMLNRIAVSGGTYEDWQEAVYGEDALRRAESPIYCGSLAGTIAFEEVVSTADTETEAAGDQPLGSLAGKGTITDMRGGNIEIHIKEPSYIIGIVSITPYIDYCNGNDFDMTELDSLNDVHKPALDEIGFQDQMLERAAWWANWYDQEEDKWQKPAGGKLPAWIEYMTSVNQTYGDFAEPNKLGWMVLNRDYEFGWKAIQMSKLDGQDLNPSSYVQDWTTYINPTKYNYQFANRQLDAQNFWIQIGVNAIARRKMSAKLIPNL